MSAEVLHQLSAGHKLSAGYDLWYRIEQRAKERKSRRRGNFGFDEEPLDQRERDIIRTFPEAPLFCPILQKLRKLYYATSEFYYTYPFKNNDRERRSLYQSIESRLVLYPTDSPAMSLTGQPAERLPVAEDKGKQIWREFACDILFNNNREQVRWEEEEGSLILSKKYLNDFMAKYGVEYVPQAIDRYIDGQQYHYDDWPFYTTGGIGEAYRLDDPNLIYHLAAEYFVPDINGDIVGRLKRKLLLDKTLLHKTIPVFSFIAERIFWDRPRHLPKFMRALAEGIGGETGFGVAGALSEDYLTMIWPFFAIVKYVLNPSHYFAFNHTLRHLSERYRVWRYKNRPEVIPADTLQAALTNPSRFWDRIFIRERIFRMMRNMFLKPGREDIKPVFRIALLEKKIIPALIMMYAHILGCNRETARRLAAIGLFTWGVTKAHDHVFDGAFTRNGQPTPLATDGINGALKAAELALLDVMQETLHDPGLTEAFLGVFRTSGAADLEMENFDWNTPIEQYFPVIMARMNEAFTWFPLDLGRRSGLTEAGQAFSEFQSSLLCLVQMNNDFNNLALPSHDDHPGSDIGTKCSMPLNIFMRLPDTTDPVLRAGKETVRRIFSEQRKRKLLSREAPSVEDNRDISTVLTIWNDYRCDVAERVYPYIIALYNQAITSLKKGFDLLPVKLKNDLVNQQYYGVLMGNLDAVVRQFNNYRKPEAVTT